MLNSLNELDGQIAQLDKEPRLGEYAGLVALSDAIADIKAILLRSAGTSTSSSTWTL